MGIAERDYARPSATGRPPGGRKGPLGLPRLSVTTWLIIINVLVFLGDGFAPRSLWLPVHWGDRINPAYAQHFDPSHAVFPSPPRNKPAHVGSGIALPIVDSRTNEIIGVRDYLWLRPLNALGHFSTAKAFFGLEIWRFITFQFLHANLNHLLLNMIGLFFFGAVVEQAMRTAKRYLAFYLVCGICGAVMYLALNVVGTLGGIRQAPFLFSDLHTPLVGASAGVFGILMAAAYFAGNATMLVFFVIPMKVRTGAYLMAAIAAGNLLLGGSNAGGDAAHIGGAIAGFFFVRNMHLLRDFFDILGPSRKPQGRGGRGPGAPSRHQQRLNRILDKVKTKGLDSLTRSEQAFLRKQSGGD